MSSGQLDGVKSRADSVLTAYSERLLSITDEHGWKLMGVIVLIGAILPFVGLNEGFYMTVISELYLFAVLALSWDLIGGQTGYPSFGQMAFFGIGAYTTAILVKDFGQAFPLAFVVAGLLATAVAGIIGVIVLRLRGGYFAIATLGILLAGQQVSRIIDITGGASGKILLEVPTATTFYYVFLGVLVVEVIVVYYLEHTQFGYILNAIRDDEGKVTSIGVNTTYYKTAAWMLAALFTGLGGGAWSLFNTFIDPATAYNLAWNVELIAMALLGGSGTVTGPVLGAFGLHALIAMVIDPFFSGWQLAVLGIVVIVVVIAFPQGFVGELKERASAMEYYKHGGGAAGDTEADSSESALGPDSAEETAGGSES